MSQYVKHTDESIRAVLNEVSELHRAWQAKEISKELYEERVKFYGWNHVPEGLLSNAYLNVGGASTLMHDWVHVYVVGGLFQVEMQLLILFLKANGIDMSLLCTFVQAWTWPRSMGEPRDAFTAKRIAFDADHYKCDANEALHLYQIVAIFLVTMLDATVCAPQVKSFLLLADVLDLLRVIKDNFVDHVLLRECILNHLRAFLVAYTKHAWLPKHHLAMHLPDTLARFMVLIALLVHERKHKVIKRWSRNRFGKTSFETGLMEEITLDHIHSLNKWCKDGVLVDPRKPRQKWLDELQLPADSVVLTSTKYRCMNGVLIHAGDMAFATIDGNTVLVEVQFHLSVDGACASCVDVLVHTPNATDARAGTATYCTRNAHRMVNSELLLCPVIFMRRDTHITAIVPACLKAVVR